MAALHSDDSEDEEDVTAEASDEESDVSDSEDNEENERDDEDEFSSEALGDAIGKIIAFIGQVSFLLPLLNENPTNVKSY